MADPVLPNLDPAPTTDLQVLVRRFIEQRDFTAVRPIVDELKALGRDDDAKAFLKELVGFRYSHVHEPWGTWCRHYLGRLFWFDLFSFDAIVADVEKFVTDGASRRSQYGLDWPGGISGLLSSMPPEVLHQIDTNPQTAITSSLGGKDING